MTSDTLIFSLIAAAISISFLWAIFIVVLKIIKAIKRVVGKKTKVQESHNGSEAKFIKADFVNFMFQNPGRGSAMPSKKDFSTNSGLARLKNESPTPMPNAGRYKFFQNSDTKADMDVRAENPKIFGNSLIKKIDDEDTNKVKPAQKSSDSSVFEGKSELTRKQLKYKLWKDPKVAKAAKESLLFLKPTERAKLEKEIFPTIYGSNISRSDVKTRMHKLSQKMLSEQNPQAKAMLRKEIKFAKKITGVK